MKKTIKEKSDSVAKLKQKIFRLENTILKCKNKVLKMEHQILDLKAENKKLKTLTYEERLHLIEKLNPDSSQHYIDLPNEIKLDKG